jgi:hypothetical protein
MMMKLGGVCAALFLFALARGAMMLLEIDQNTTN